jgi:hypothetical protein
MSPGDPYYFVASLAMLAAIAAVGALPVWLAVKYLTPRTAWLANFAWLAVAVVPVLAGFSDPHDFIRYFVFPAFATGWLFAALTGAWLLHKNAREKNR